MCTETQKEEKSSNSSSPKHDDSNILLRNVSGLIFIIWFLYLTCAPRIIPGFKCLVYWVLPHGLLYDEKGDINWGTLGDYFGALNCLFAGLAFAAVYVSIRQQSKAINIQQNELDAQLEEMKDSVKEAREQTKLQIKYQFSDEFYRRINMLKSIEKDITYKDFHGIEAVIELASDIDNLILSIIDNKLAEASSTIQRERHHILLALDTFTVWGKSFISLASDVYSQGATQAILGIKNAKKREEIKLLLKQCKTYVLHYHSIMISSSIWGEHYLLLLLYNAIEENSEINKLKRIPDFCSGQTAEKARTKRYQYIFKSLYFINMNMDIDKQISDIYKEQKTFGQEP